MFWSEIWHKWWKLHGNATLMEEIGICLKGKLGQFVSLLLGTVLCTEPCLFLERTASVWMLQHPSRRRATHLASLLPPRPKEHKTSTAYLLHTFESTTFIDRGLQRRAFGRQCASRTSTLSPEFPCSRSSPGSTQSSLIPDPFFSASQYSPLAAASVLLLLRSAERLFFPSEGVLVEAYKPCVLNRFVSWLIPGSFLPASKYPLLATERLFSVGRSFGWRLQVWRAVRFCLNIELDYRMFWNKERCSFWKSWLVEGREGM